ncbi:hypothetical protein N7530_006833 [Penicillium desertorum]|uniref:Uncharacterized protein n=1 Tax=Penicillium desertorum TaxID=1303715 RepID=A0A9W9WT70_9EURO|nr:hypothetical protein N7530_006833 [Penicillium desertorum]
MPKFKDEATRSKRLADAGQLAEWRLGSCTLQSTLFAFDAIYWKNIDQQFFGSTAEDDVCESWRKRLHPLEPEEINFTEESVDLAIKVRDTLFFLSWDLSEYAVEWNEKMRVIR